MGYTSVGNKEPIKDEDGSEVTVAYSLFTNDIRLEINNGWSGTVIALISSAQAREVANLLLFAAAEVAGADSKSL